MVNNFDFLFFPVIILVVQSSEIRKYMLEAEDANMVDGEYAFVWMQQIVSEEFLFDGKPWKGIEWTILIDSF